MAISLLHSFQSAKADGADSSLVQPSAWNAEHTITMATNKLLGRGTAGTGAVEEITLGTGLSLAGTTLNATAAQNLFQTISVSGQSDVVADSSTDTLTLAAGSNITITTNATTDTITIAATGGSPGGSNTQIQFNDSSSFGGSADLTWDGSSLVLGSAKALAWSTDLFLVRDAANALALRNSTNAQALRIYNSYTDGSNYSRLVINYPFSNTAQILASGAGTGAGTITALNIGVSGSSNGSFNWNYSTSNAWTFVGGPLVYGTDNTYDFGATGARPRDLLLGRNLTMGGYQDLTEIAAPAAPSANGARIYAVDNGAGKTQLMVRFASGAAQQIAIEP